MPNNAKKQEKDRYSLVKRIKEDTRNWRKDVSSILKFNPNSEEYVSFQCYSKDERNEFLKDPKNLDEDDFRLQIGSMKKKGTTIYNEITLGLGIQYMINHTKKGHKSIIQIWSDVGKNLQEGAEEGLLSAEEQKEYLENFIRKKFGKKGEETLKVEIGSKKYPEVFEAIKNGKNGIIPDKEPKLESMVPFKSPLDIIKYLAYHANKDKEEKKKIEKNLMYLSRRTKPPKYLDLSKEPGDSDADFYGIVEVGLRLFEVLNGVSIQGGMGRQRVYDKIISLIVNGEDLIKGKKKFDCADTIHIQNYPALQKLHDICGQHYPNIKFNQVYIDLDREGIDEIKDNLNTKSKLRSKLETWGYGSLIALILAGGTWYGASEYSKYNEKNKQEKFEEERLKMSSEYRKAVNFPRYSGYGSDYLMDQGNILMAKYNISKQNHVDYTDDGKKYIASNDIVEMYRRAFRIKNKETEKLRSILWEKLGGGSLKWDNLSDEEKKFIDQNLYGIYTAEDFYNENGEHIIDLYHIPRQPPYEHFKQYQKYIDNTLKYGGKINISKYKTKEIPTESELFYFIERPLSHQPHGMFSIKIVRVYLDDGKTIDLIVAKHIFSYYFISSENLSEYTYKNGYLCMKDLQDKYVKFWRSELPNGFKLIPKNPSKDD